MENYKIEKIAKNMWRITYPKKIVQVIWEEGNFNKTQEHVLLDNSNLNAQSISKVMREIGDYLYNNHYEIIFDDDFARSIKRKKLSS